MEANKPKVSIVIPVYNGSNYLREAIDSAINQTYENIEILVINDGSNDGGATRDIALSYGKKIRYFEKENGGVSSALNMGIENMTGDFFSWLSHDDVYYLDKIEKQIGYLNSILMTDRRTVLYCNIDYIDGKSVLRGSRQYNLNHYNESGLFLFNLLSEGVHGCSLLIPKDFFSEVGLFDDNLKTIQDHVLWYQGIKYYRFVHQDVTLIKSRRHDAQGTRMLRAECFTEQKQFYEITTGKSVREAINQCNDWNPVFDLSLSMLRRGLWKLSFSYYSLSVKSLLKTGCKQKRKFLKSSLTYGGAVLRRVYKRMKKTVKNFL